MSTPSRTHHVLPNGLPLVTTSQPQLHGICIALAVRTGGRDDTPRTWGLSHFVEHMMFRGSAAYPDAAALVAPFEQGGSTLQAETWRDHTLFWAVVHPKHLEAALAALGDMMARPRFDDIELERSLVQAELAIDIDEDGQDTDIGALSRSAIFGPHGMGRRIVGSPASLAGLSQSDVRRRHKRAYVGRNMALSIAGPITPARAHKLALKHFAALPEGAPLPLGRPPTFRRGPVVTCPQPVSQTTLQLTFAALPDGHEDFTALSLLVALLDDGMGTRLHRALSERSGLVYAFSTGLDCYGDCGLYDIEMQVSPERVQAALQETLAVLRAVADGGVTAQELGLAQERALMAMELGQDSVEDLAQEAAVDVLFGRPAPKSHRAAIMRTTVADIARLARAMFVQAARRITVLGAMDGLDTKALAAAVDKTLADTAEAAAPVKRKTGSPASTALSPCARRTRAARCTAAKPRR